MEQVNKHTVSNRRANSLKEYQQNRIANSNALHSTSGTFAELSANAKRLLGLSTKKLFTASDSKGLQNKEIFIKIITKEIIAHDYDLFTRTNARN